MNIAEIPIESCMFAKLPRPSGSGSERRQELVYAFEALLPIPVDQCQMALTEVGQHVIGCACLKAELEPLRSIHERAIPSQLPDWIKADDPHQCRSRLNLLTGEMQSSVRVIRRDRTLQLASVTCLAIAALVFLASQRLSNQWAQQSEVVREDIQAMYEAVLPPAQGNAQPDAIRFTTLMNQLGSSRTGARDQSNLRLVDDFALLLADWPQDIQAQARSISVDQGVIRLEVSMPDNDRALSMLEYLSAQKSWEIRSREITPAADRVELRVQIARLGGKASDA